MNNQKSNSKPEPAEQPSGKGLSSSVLLGVVERRWECTLDQCPPGLFLFDGDYGFKTEYRDDNGPEAYCVESGEYFWGAAGGDKEARRNLQVQPVIICSPNRITSTAMSEERAKLADAACSRRFIARASKLESAARSIQPRMEHEWKRVERLHLRSEIMRDFAEVFKAANAEHTDQP